MVNQGRRCMLRSLFMASTLLALVMGALVPAARAQTASNQPAVSKKPATTKSKKVEFVTIQKGTLPVILSAPHGGELDLPGSLPRDRKSGGSRFQTVRDVRSSELAEAIANQLEAEFGQRPYVVILRVSRKYLDANREADYAYESPEAQVVYDEYHGAIEQFKKSILEKHGSGLLIDVHGQSKEKGAVYRGTRNGLTISALNRRVGKDAASLYSKVMEDAGLRVIPPSTAAPNQEVEYNGGEIVVAHGSQNPGGIDCIQMEFGADLRSVAALPQTAKDFVKGLSPFLKEHYGVSEQRQAAAGGTSPAGR